MRDKSKHSMSKGKKPSVKFEDPGEDAKQDEDCKMEVDGDADSRKKNETTNELRKIGDFKKIRKKRGSKIWRKLNDMLQEHEPTQRRSQNLQSLEDKLAQSRNIRAS